MNYFLRIGAYVWHPLLMPLLGTVMYFIITPRYVDEAVLQSKLIAIVILSLLIPIVVYFLLKTIGWVHSIKLEQVWERKIPLMLQSIIFLAIIKLIFDPYITPELYFFFVGILFLHWPHCSWFFLRLK